MGLASYHCSIPQNLLPMPVAHQTGGSAHLLLGYSAPLNATLSTPVSASEYVAGGVAYSG
jgi:hypothetical protein